MADEDDTSTESPRFFDARQSIESKHETTHASDTSRSAPQHGPDNPFSGEWLSNLIARGSSGWCQPGAKLHGGVGLPTIARGMQSLRSSRLRAIYTEVAPTFTVFGALFGKALQAQAQIAMANTVLTALGM
ncbi:hypothetical protein WJX82_000995 [Trebouxia sp. C0006]